MRVYIGRKLLVVETCIMSGLSAWGQVPTASNTSNDGPIEIAVNFEAERANTVPASNFWTQGGGVQGAWNISHH